MIKMNKILIILLAVITLVSCTADQNIPELNNDDAIRLKSSFYNASLNTRTPFTDVISASNVLKSAVWASETPGDYTAGYKKYYANGTMTFSSSTASTIFDEGYNGTNIFPYEGTDATLYLYGLYPIIGWNTNNPNAPAFTITGKEDVMIAKEVTTKRSEIRVGTYQTLEFNHILSKFEIRVAADGPSAIAHFGSIKSISLIKAKGVDLKNELHISNITTGEVAYNSDGATNTLNCYEMSIDANGHRTYSNTIYANKEVPLTKEPTYQAYTIAAPVTLLADDVNDYTFAVTTTKDGVDTTTPVDVELKNASGAHFTGSTAGQTFLITFNFAKDDIRVKVAITEWVNSGKYTSPIERD